VNGSQYREKSLNVIISRCRKPECDQLTIQKALMQLDCTGESGSQFRKPKYDWFTIHIMFVVVETKKPGCD
jgi:hypothetical protein